MSSETSCPNCGAALPDLLAHARMVNCDFCGSSVVRDDDVVAKAGEAGAMLDAPELVAVGVPVRLGQEGTFTATGHVRYDYGRGHWDEYHGSLDTGGLIWVSVDEGDIVLQRPVTDGAPALRGTPRIGSTLAWGGTDYDCTEVSSAKAVAFRGQLPEAIVVGESHMFANFSGPRGLILSLETWEEGRNWFAGVWIDPFQVERLL
ncbi:MAG: DUF4178 domain-containing protein [Pseudomonadota bacterium]